MAAKRKPGRPKKVIDSIPELPNKQEFETPKNPFVDEGPLCECGKPVAPGQSYVCKDHIRSS